MITQTQKDEFYNGFVQSLLWSSSDTDYSEPPEGYETAKSASDAEIACGDSPGYYWMVTGWNDADSSERVYETERQAIIAAWEDSRQDAPDLDGLDGHDLAPITARRLREYCDTWCDMNAELIGRYAVECVKRGIAHVPYSSAGYDLALTANGQGTGFWDRGLGELGDDLTAVAKANYSECPEGFGVIEKADGRWLFTTPFGSEWESKSGATKQHAIIAAWEYSGDTPAVYLGTMFEAYIGDDGLVYVEGFKS